MENEICVKCNKDFCGRLCNTAYKGFYEQYIQSDEWKLKSKRTRSMYEKCVVCGSIENLQVHHMNYKNLGNEEEDDLVCLCEECHQKYHYDVLPAMVKKAENHISKLSSISKFIYGIDQDVIGYGADLLFGDYESRHKNHIMSLIRRVYESEIKPGIDRTIHSGNFSTQTNYMQICKKYKEARNRLLNKEK